MKDEIIKKLLEYLEGTKDFLLVEGSEIFREMIIYTKIFSIIFSIISLFIMVLSIIIFIKKYKQSCKISSAYHDIDKKFTCNVFCTISGIISLFSFCFFCDFLKRFLFCTFAPKFYLIKWILNK